MKFILNESQYKRIFESDNVITKLNNMINSDIHKIEDNYGTVTVILNSIELFGSIESIDEVVVNISKVYWREQDVTDFAMNHVLFSERNNESDLSYDLKNKITNILNRKYLKYINAEVSDYDISFDY